MSYFDMMFWAICTGYAVLIVVVLNLARANLTRMKEREPDEH